MHHSEDVSVLVYHCLNLMSMHISSCGAWSAVFLTAIRIIQFQLGSIFPNLGQNLDTTTPYLDSSCEVVQDLLSIRLDWYVVGFIAVILFSSSIFSHCYLTDSHCNIIKICRNYKSSQMAEFSMCTFKVEGTHIFKQF